MLPSVCRVQPLIPSSVPFLTVTILGMELPALLDTGQGLSLTRDAVLE